MQYYEDDQFHGDEVVMACSASEGAEKCIKQFNRKTWTDNIATVSIKENNIKIQIKCDCGGVIRLLRTWTDTGALSCIHCCRGKAMSITYSECVFVDLGIQHLMRMRHTVICGLSGVQYFSHIS